MSIKNRYFFPYVTLQDAFGSNTNATTKGNEKYPLGKRSSVDGYPNSLPPEFGINHLKSGPDSHFQYAPPYTVADFMDRFLKETSNGNGGPMTKPDPFLDSLRDTALIDGKLRKVDKNGNPIDPTRPKYITMLQRYGPDKNGNLRPLDKDGNPFDPNHTIRDPLPRYRIIDENGNPINTKDAFGSINDTIFDENGRLAFKPNLPPLPRFRLERIDENDNPLKPMGRLYSGLPVSKTPFRPWQEPAVPPTSSQETSPSGATDSENHAVAEEDQPPRRPETQPDQAP